MRAAILAVGSELLGSDKAETNSLRLAAVLHRHGVAVARKSVAGDDLDEIASQVVQALDGCELLLVSGGLGPTADDLTREGVARALGVGLRRRPEIEDEIEAKFRGFRLRMPESNRRQADVVDGGVPLDNPWGTAPGQRIETGGRTIFLLPGVPRELEAMAASELDPWLAERSGGRRVETRCLKVACLPESTLDEMLRPYYNEHGSETVTILTSRGDLTLQVTAAGADAERDAVLGARLRRLEELVGDAVYGGQVADTLESVVGKRLRAAGRTVATAESCTGGLVAERLTAVPGSSAYFLGGVVAYANEIKTGLLGVPPELIVSSGAVSEPVVEAMAAGARHRLGADFAVGVSGIAGPGGGSADKPVGTVFLAIEGPDGRRRRQRLRLPGDREVIRRLASQWALELLRRTLAGLETCETPR